MRRLLLFLLLAGCNTTIEDVCENVADCSHGGDIDFTQQCQASNGGLETEARNVGCGDQFKAYYDCANEKFTCTGNVSTFPGCDRIPLDTCIAAARTGTACTELASRCGSADAGACDASRSCAAGCYLRVVKNACAPTAEELDGVAVCTAACTP